MERHPVRRAGGSDVAELQVRVAGWAGYGVTMAIDGAYGPQTRATVASFQSAYGLPVDGVAGPATYCKIHELQDADCTPAHFSWAEVDAGCGVGGYSGGSVSAATAQQNLQRATWRPEALRHRMGDQPLTVTSGFRSQSCDRAVGGSGIFGPAYPGHDDHTHVDIGSTRSWSAPRRGI